MYFKSKEEIDEASLSPLQKEIYTSYTTSHNLIQEFCDRHFEYSNDQEMQKEEFKWNFYLHPEEIFVNLFKNAMASENLKNEIIVSPPNTNEINFKQANSSLEYETDPDSDKIKLKTDFDVNLLSFQSSVNFVNLLCTICEKMKDVPNEEQMAFLRKELMQINKTLPSNVYIPFLKDSVRNYIICHIPVTEMKIFRTKNRAPYMLTVEIIRIDEIINVLLKNEKTKRENNRQSMYNPNFEKSHSNNSHQNNSNMMNVEHSVNPNSTYSPPEILKGRSYSMATSNNDRPNDNDLYLIKKSDLQLDPKNIKKQNAKSFLDPKMYQQTNNFNNIRKKTSTLLMLEESDIRLSKPVIISNLEADIKRAPLRGEKKIILEENEDYEESFIKEGMDDMVKRRLTMHPMNNKRYSSKILDENPVNKSASILRTEDQDIINIKTRGRVTTYEPVRKNNLLEENESREVIIVESKPSFIGESSNEQSSSISENFQNIFGELIEDQANRIRKFSPFGQFNTWGLFKMIVKSGEDLRQEQFATQLINEFHQIFQIEKVKCWVNSYEILATGDNVGIIECVPNAISIDQLKKKIGNNTLRSFFENYFGPTDTKSKYINFINLILGFKHAMNNFISSLAGYSLVCYFLQIKDRHNANILIDNQGHLIHIDFGFLLSNAPGKGLKFEKVPFKLTSDFVEAMGGVNSKYFEKFRKLLWK
jgi:phosphatidylinositol 4-kinase B